MPDNILERCIMFGVNEIIGYYMKEEKGAVRITKDKAH